MTTVQPTIRTLLRDMPGSIRGFVKAEDDCYTIVLNASLSFEQQRETFHHEVDHILNGDCYSTGSADQIESDLR